ncbi:hypothetical protein IFM89_001309 [Coptis chinensis]|uniref:Endonuclease/exonuclease/phosphatase n=1 Tax=Coptis chinensis TaxID=261450 RepID=A0A835ITK1_9MAGN|nr:hypothetical protein IFM89_001309 [Coptis chinensis]
MLWPLQIGSGSLRRLVHCYKAIGQIRWSKMRPKPVSRRDISLSGRRRTCLHRVPGRRPLPPIINEYTILESEPLIKPPNVLPPVLSKHGFSAIFLHNNTLNRVGNILLFWREGMSPTLVSLSEQQITAQVENYLISFVHASCSYCVRRQLWQELTMLGQSGQAWAVIGDFNIVTSFAERKGGGTPCISAMDDFNFFIHSNALIDSTTSGKAWISNNTLREVVAASWEEPLFDVPIRKVVKKLKRLKQKLKSWSFEVFGNQAQHLKRLEEEMDQILLDQEVDPSDSTIQQMEFDKAAEIDEVTNVMTTMAKEKSRVSDALHGERNSAYFHATIRMRQLRAQIIEIKNREGLMGSVNSCFHTTGAGGAFVAGI